MIDYSPINPSKECYIGFQFVKNNHDMDMNYMYIPLDQGEKDLEDYFENGIYKNSLEILKQAIPCVLYLASENKDVEVVKYIGKNQIEKNKKIIKSGCITTKVGYKIGVAFKKHNIRYVGKSYSKGSGGTKSPHFRRAHYHHYWTGKKDGSEERKLILKF